MAFSRQCPKCGLDLTDTSTVVCPMCGSGVSRVGTGSRWIAGLVQIAVSTTFMLVFGFPRIMIAIFAAFILGATALSARLKPTAVRRPAMPRPVSHPVLNGVLAGATALASFAFVGVLFLGSAMFLNSWQRWTLYRDQPFHRTDFQVTQAYFSANKGRRTGPSVYASGMVEGQKEWMSLVPYLHFVPRSQEELDGRVPVGTSIGIYFFPHMNGRARVQVFSKTPVAESAHAEAMRILDNGLLALAAAAALVFLLVRVRGALCRPLQNEFPAGSYGLISNATPTTDPPPPQVVVPNRSPARSTSGAPR